MFSSLRGMSDAETADMQAEFTRRAEVEAGKPKNKFPQLWNLFQELSPKVEAERVERAFKKVIECYSEPHRGYHNVDHLIDLARHFEDHRELFGEDTKAVIASLFYHDIVYKAQPGQDEKASATVMYQELTSLNVDSDVIERAEGIIKLTATHDAPKEDFSARLFLDMDMAILGARPDDYDRYVDGVATEFCTKHAISRQEFDIARIEMFVKPTLEKGVIFTTEQFAPYNIIAMRNLNREKSGVNYKPQGQKPL